MYSVDQHFDGRSPVVREIYDALVSASKQFGPVVEEPKKTSIHLANKSAFAGVATRKDAIVLTIKSGTDIRSRRIRKHEQVSAKRWHLEVRLKDPADVDAELKRWLSRAFDLS